MSVAGDKKWNERSARADRKGTGARGEASWRGYINVNLSVQQKQQFDDWVRTGEPWDVFGEAVSSGCVVSVKFDSGTSACLASVTQRNAGHVNAGLCVTARGRSPDVALFRVLFIVAILTVEGSWEAAHPLADPDRW